jgi:glycogen debranching enzyme
VTVDDRILSGAEFAIEPSPEFSATRKLVLKREEAFLVADLRGDFVAHIESELGFYYEGTRHLRWLELRLDGAHPFLLNAEASPENDTLTVALTNGHVGALPMNTLHVHRTLRLDPDALHQSLAITSYHDTAAAVQVELIFAADFKDVFEVRGMRRPARGQLLGEEHAPGAVRLAYRGLDGVVRETELGFDPAPTVIAAHRAVYRLGLEPRTTVRVAVAVRAGHTGSAGSRPTPRPRPPRARILSDNAAFDQLVGQSLVDLDMLMTQTAQGRVPYAGVPWYVAPFGRDSIITALQLLPYDASIAAGTLRFLAAWQGRVADAFLDEEPGKMMHEYRRGEMANCREIPFIPYYGTIDATPLFLMLLHEYVRWTDDAALLAELWPAARAALAWMRAGGDPDGDGYLAYATRSPLGLSNQGWKDSGDAVMHADGALAATPIALVEVQGYAYAAWRGAAELAAGRGEPDAAALNAQADRLREAFNRDFWMEHEGFYALALDGAKRRCEVIASNVGHALWTGVVDERRAVTVAKRLLEEDMFSGWGIRTLAARERRYNPMSYHNGSVWPHDNALAAAGFRRYRLGEHVLTVATGLLEASRYFDNARLPELFCGFPRRPDHGPVFYPVACAPQAWASGSALALVTALLGLEADAAARRLTLQSPVLPPPLRRVEIEDLRVGSASVDLGITRGRDSAAVEVLGRRGDVEVIVRR